MFMLGAIFLYILLPMSLGFYAGAAGSAVGGCFGVFAGTVVGGAVHAFFALSTRLTRVAYGGADRLGFVAGVSFSSGGVAAFVGSLVAAHFGILPGTIVGAVFGSGSIELVRLFAETVCSTKKTQSSS